MPGAAEISSRGAAGFGSFAEASGGLPHSLSPFSKFVLYWTTDGFFIVCKLNLTSALDVQTGEKNSNLTRISWDWENGKPFFFAWKMKFFFCWLYRTTENLFFIICKKWAGKISGCEHVNLQTWFSQVIIMGRRGKFL